MNAPTSVTAQWQNGQREVSITWVNNDPSVDAYAVARSDDRGEFVLLDDALPPDAVNFIDDTPVNDVVYQYKVYPIALSVDGPAGYSDILPARDLPVFPEVSGLLGFNFWVEPVVPVDPAQFKFRTLVMSPAQARDTGWPQNPVPDEEVQLWQQ